MDHPNLIDPKERERQLCRAVRKFSGALLHIKNPSLAVQMAAVQSDGFAIQYIQDPTPEVQAQAVRQKPAALRFIRNPSEEVLLMAVRQNGSAVQYISDPSEEVQHATVQENPFAIEFIQNPSESVQLAAVQKDGCALAFVKNPSKAVQLEALSRNFFVISFLDASFAPTPSELISALAASNNINGPVDFEYATNGAASVCAGLLSTWPIHHVERFLELLPDGLKDHPAMIPATRSVLAAATSESTRPTPDRLF